MELKNTRPSEEKNILTTKSSKQLRIVDKWKIVKLILCYSQKLCVLYAERPYIRSKCIDFSIHVKKYRFQTVKYTDHRKTWTG